MTNRRDPSPRRASPRRVRGSGDGRRRPCLHCRASSGRAIPSRIEVHDARLDDHPARAEPPGRATLPTATVFGEGRHHLGASATSVEPSTCLSVRTGNPVGVATGSSDGSHNLRHEGLSMIWRPVPRGRARPRRTRKSSEFLFAIAGASVGKLAAAMSDKPASQPIEERLAVAWTRRIRLRRTSRLPALGALICKGILPNADGTDTSPAGGLPSAASVKPMCRQIGSERREPRASANASSLYLAVKLFFLKNLPQLRQTTLRYNKPAAGGMKIFARALANSPVASLHRMRELVAYRMPSGRQSDARLSAERLSKKRRVSTRRSALSWCPLQIQNLVRRLNAPLGRSSTGTPRSAAVG